MKFFTNTQHYRSLVREARAGDGEAFRQIFDETHQKLFSYVASRVANREDATDIIQDLYVDLWRALPNFDFRSDQAFIAFIFTIIRRKLAHYYEAEGHNPTELLENAPELAKSDKIKDEYGLHTLLDRLRPEYREVLELRYWSDLAFKDIAATMDQNLSTIKTWHKRAIQELDNLLKQYD